MESKERRSREQDGDTEGEDVDKERMLIFNKGRFWDESRNIEDVLIEQKEEGEWSLVKCGEEGETIKVLFNKKEDREKIWRRKERLRKEESLNVDEWLSFEDRVKRKKMVEDKKELEEIARKKGINLEVRVENKRIKIGNEWFRREKDRYEKINEKREGPRRVQERESSELESDQ